MILSGQAKPKQVFVISGKIKPETQFPKGLTLLFFSKTSERND